MGVCTQDEQLKLAINELVKASFTREDAELLAPGIIEMANATET